VFDFLYIGLGSFDDPSWFGTQRFALALSSIGRVLFVQRPVTFFNILSGRKRISVSNWPLRFFKENLWLYTPVYFFPFGHRVRASEIVNRKLNVFILRRALKHLHFRNAILWLDDPFQGDWIGQFGERFVVYNCLHEYGLQPNRLRPELGFDRGPDGLNRYNLKIEREILKKADLVFCETPSRAERKKSLHERVFVISHGVDFSSFQEALRSDYLPDDLKAIPQPIIGFSGTVNRDKFDFSLMEFLARERPGWSFVMVGRIYRNTVLPERLKSLSNVHFLGERPYQEIPHYLKGFDVCIIPYLKTRVTDDIQTLKIYEYLALGKPVVTTDLKHFRQFPDELVLRAASAQEFLQKIEWALEYGGKPGLAKRRMELAQRNSWHERARTIQEILQTYLKV
jgi:glycosyltransferase involved in cell wall biosynthesis